MCLPVIAKSGLVGVSLSSMPFVLCLLAWQYLTWVLFTHSPIWKEKKSTFVHFISDKQFTGDVRQYLLSHKGLIFISLILYYKQIEILIIFILRM